MPPFRRFLPNLLMSALALAGCSPTEQPSSAPAEASAGATAPDAPLPMPAIDTANASQFAEGGSQLETPEFPRTGSVTVQGSVKGDTSPVYAVAAAKGQTLTVTLQSPSSNLYVNVSDAKDHSGAALHRGEVDGPSAKLTAPADMTYVITPFQPRAQARRGESGDFSLAFARD